MIDEKTITGWRNTAGRIEEFLGTNKVLFADGEDIMQGAKALKDLADRETESKEPPKHVWYSPIMEDDRYSYLLTFDCPKCGQNFESKGFEYCPYCGQKLPKKIITPSSRGYYEFRCDPEKHKYIDEEAQYQTYLSRGGTLEREYFMSEE